MHILADYLADDPDATEITSKSGFVSAYDGKASVEINGGIPQFTQKEKIEKIIFLHSVSWIHPDEQEQLLQIFQKIICRKRDQDSI